MGPSPHFGRTSDGVMIGWVESGSGPPLVHLPGVPFSNLEGEWRIPDLQAAFERLGRSVRLVQYDGRGTGLSQRDVADFSLAAMEADLDAVVAGQTPLLFGDVPYHPDVGETGQFGRAHV